MLPWIERVSFFGPSMINYKEEKGKYATLQTNQNTQKVP